MYNKSMNNTNAMNRANTIPKGSIKRNVVKRAIAMLVASALAFGSSLCAATAADAYEMNLDNVTDHVTYDVTKRVPAVESQAGLQKLDTNGSGDVVLPGTMGADSALVRISVFNPSQDATITVAGIPVLAVTTGQDSSTTTLVSVVDGKASINASAELDVRVEVLATFVDDTNAPGATNQIAQPVSRPIASLNVGDDVQVGVLGLGGVPSNQVRAVYLTADVTLDAAAVVTIAGQRLSLPQGRSVVSTVALPNAASGAVTVNATSDGQIELTARGWISDVPVNANAANVSGSFVPTVGVDWSALKASAAKEGEIEVAGMSDRALSLVLVSADASESRSFVDVGRTIAGRSQGILVDDKAGALPQLEVVESSAAAVPVSVRGADVTVSVLPVGDILGAPTEGGSTEVAITSPENNSVANLAEIGKVTLTGTVKSDMAINDIAIFGGETEIGRADVVYTPEGVQWRMEVAAPENGKTDYVVKATSRGGVVSEAKVTVDVQLPDDDAIVVNPDVTVIKPDDASSKVKSVQEDKIIFENEPIFGIGAVIVSSIGENAPEGFIRRVTAIEQAEQGWIVSTSAATLTDTFLQAEIDESPSLSSENSTLTVAQDNPNDNINFVGIGGSGIIEPEEETLSPQSAEAASLRDIAYTEPSSPRQNSIVRTAEYNRQSSDVAIARDSRPQVDLFKDDYAVKVSCEAVLERGEDGKIKAEMCVGDDEGNEEDADDGDSEDSEENDLKISGGISLALESAITKLGVNFELKIVTNWHWFVPTPELRYFHADLHGNFDSEFTAKAYGELTGEVEQELFSLDSTTIIWAGPVPIVLNLKNPISLVGELTVEATVRYTNTWSKYFEFGKEKVNGEWKDVRIFRDAEAPAETTPCTVAEQIDVTLDFTVLVGVKDNLSIKLYDIAGPEITVTAQAGVVDGKVKFNAANGGNFTAKYILRLRGEGKITAEIPVIDWSLGEIKLTPYEPDDIVLLDVNNTIPGFCSSNGGDDEDGDKQEYRLSGTVTDAENGDVLAGARVEIVADNGEGMIVFRHANAEGKFSAQLDEGTYLLRVKQDGYVEYLDTVKLNKDESLSIALTKPLTSNTEFRAVLTWGEYPYDEDSHLYGTDGSADPYHVYYADKDAYDNQGNRVAWLDVDDTDSFGPETLTFNVSPKGSYSYYVHNYSGDAPLNTSSAKVVLYRGDELVKTYSIPANWSNQEIWEVFSIVNGEVVDYVDPAGDEFYGNSDDIQPNDLDGSRKNDSN
ncbi:hypothetical protein BAAM0483_08150 [Bifidobacterium animalis subsp. animalis MCC 0483]|uniref:PEGA domain-containing protein n=2 Tax=Bifidobacterium animalis TaxID=28025 RepID=A0AB34T809_9BIFI|nr:hypothetical protein BAAM0483_08150 [Bifidobacterium animalis subsp. animalis MCC 0483]